MFLDHLWSGFATDCGCFGHLRVSPQATALFTALGTVTFAVEAISLQKPTFVAALRASFLVGALFLLSSMLVNVHRKEPSAMRDWAENLIAHLPDTEREMLRHGSWRILVINPDCSTCLMRVESLASENVGGEEVLLVLVGNGQGLAEADRLGWRQLAEPDLRPICLPLELSVINGVMSDLKCNILEES
jgi:hypothetical protein